MNRFLFFCLRKFDKKNSNYNNNNSIILVIKTVLLISILFIHIVCSHAGRFSIIISLSDFYYTKNMSKSIFTIDFQKII